MNNNHFVWIKIKDCNYYKLLNKLNTIGIQFYDVKSYKYYTLLKINYIDYKKVTKYLFNYRISLVSETGFYKIKNIIKNYYVFFIGLFIGVIYLFIANNMVININIITNDKNIKSSIKESLNHYNLKVLTFKKKHKDIEKIVDKILDDNKKTIEWLEIKYDGMNMVVLVTKKEKGKHNKDLGICNIVAKSDAKILSYNLKKGEVLFKLNQYVYKDEVLVTGIIKYNNEIKDNVCAQATIYGEVWYKVNIEIPFKSKKYVETGKSKYNIEIINGNHNYKILRSRFSKYNKTEENIYKLNDFKINITKELEKKEKVTYLTEKEAYNKALQLVDKKIINKLDEDEQIIYKNVLKKSVNDSTIVLDVFVVTKEKIGKNVSVKEVELNDINGTVQSD